MSNLRPTTRGPEAVIQRLNKKQKETFTGWVEENKEYVRTNLKTGDNRNAAAKSSNFFALKGFLQQAGINTAAVKDVGDAAVIIEDALRRTVEWSATAPPVDAARLVEKQLAGVSHVHLNYNGIDVYLDDYQLKHQPLKSPEHVIGTRKKGGGNRFSSDYATPAWHMANTMVHMGEWAEGLELREGETREHGQFKPVNEIHYEGSCLFAGGRKYVTFHCYPSDGSDMLGEKG